MPKLPVISSAELIAALERLGFEQRRGKGSHIVLRRGDRVCVVPHRREMKRGTLTGVLDQAGIGVNELLDALR